MDVRITKLRMAMDALFVLAGIGLGSLLSPLVGTALATAGQVVNVSDPAAPYTAKVTSAGELKTNGVVSGKVAPALPPQPFSVSPVVHSGDGGKATFLGPTTATVALTDLSFDNYFGNQARELVLYQYSAAAPNASCTFARSRIVAAYDAPSAHTVVQDFTTPIVLKPLASGDAWCLIGSMTAPAGDANFGDFVTLGGYVLSGTFTPPAGPQMRKR